MTFGWSLTGCGATEEEMAAKDRSIAVLSNDLRATRSKLTENEAKLGELQSDTTRLRDQLKQAGLGSDRFVMDPSKVQEAVLEYRQRSELTAMTEARMKDLRAKLEKLSASGVRVLMRNARLTIELPSDLLFEAGRDDLRRQGREALSQIAEVLRSDRDLANRDFVASAHTDNSKAAAGGPFKDNLGLSLARAREVMLFLVDHHRADPKNKADIPGGGLNASRWSAAGHGDLEPIAGTVELQSKEDQQRNRRVELVVEPTPDEIINVPPTRDQGREPTRERREPPAPSAAPPPIAPHR
jgi:chemotaxis protein MotB